MAKLRHETRDQTKRSLQRHSQRLETKLDLAQSLARHLKREKMDLEEQLGELRVQNDTTKRKYRGLVNAVLDLVIN